MSDSSARATVRGGGVSASVEFRFRPEGTMESSFVPDRLLDDGKNPPVPRPWQGRYLTYRQEQGMIVPHESVVEWLLPGGTFAYWRGRPTAIEYEYAGP
jgi:hypothetical protein